MTVQKKLYTLAERKLVLWSIVAMLLMGASFMVTSYTVSTTWLGESSEELHQVHRDRLDLILALLTVQGIILAIGIVLSLLFARRALRPIRQAHQAQADFAANAHHQLRTPVAVMQAEVDTALLRKNQRPEDYKRTLKSMLDELHLLRTTSERLLLQADGTAPNGTYHTSQDVTDVLPILARRYQVQVSTAITPGLATSVSRDQLAICLESLLDNTAKHAGKPLKDLAVHITLEKRGNTANLIYRDNGKGIAAGEEKRIFKRNFRGKRALQNEVQGSGLGLAILAEIITFHKGTVKAANVRTGGLQITANIPLAAKR